MKNKPAHRRSIFLSLASASVLNKFAIVTIQGKKSETIDLELDGEQVSLKKSKAAWRLVHNTMSRTMGTWEHRDETGKVIKWSLWLDSPFYEQNRKILTFLEPCGHPDGRPKPELV
jgi:hypothetical protein